jgi:hypothetical protein
MMRGADSPSMLSSTPADDPVITDRAAFTGWSAFADHDKSEMAAE